MLKVYILTYAPTPQQIPGNLLALNSARVGFPNALIYIYDNHSCDPARAEFKRLSEKHNYSYTQIDHKFIGHWDFIQIVVNNASGPIVLLDSDVILWKNCEHFLDAYSDNQYFDDYLNNQLVIRGHLWPGRSERKLDPDADSQTNRIRNVYRMPRLHSSFLAINDCEKLSQMLEPIEQALGRNPWEPGIISTVPGLLRHIDTASSCVLHRWYDTGSTIYNHPQLHECHKPFTDEELDCFDHLTNGAHPEVYEGSKTTFDSHRLLADKDFAGLRGTSRRLAKEMEEQHAKGVYWQKSFPDLKP